MRDTHQRQGEKGQPGYRLAVETRKKPIQPMGVFARFGGHHFITRHQVDVPGTIHMLTKEDPKQGGPRDHRRKKRCTVR